MFCFVDHGEALLNLNKANKPPQRIWKSERLIGRRNMLTATDSFIVYLCFLLVFIFSFFFRVCHGRKDEREIKKKRKWKLYVNLRTANTSETPWMKIDASLCVFQLCLCLYSYLRNDTFLLFSVNSSIYLNLAQSHHCRWYNLFQNWKIYHTVKK